MLSVIEKSLQLLIVSVYYAYLVDLRSTVPFIYFFFQYYRYTPSIFISN